MVSTRKKRQSNKRLLSQLDDFDQDMINGSTASERQENVVVNESTNVQDFTVGTSNVSPVINKNAMNVKTLERCFNERTDREMNNIVDTVEDRIQNAILAAVDNIVAPKIELAIRSIYAPSGRDVTSVSANSEYREHAGINASFENASEDNNTIGVTNINDEARRISQDGVSGLSVPGTQFDRQSHIHHVTRGVKGRHTMPAGGSEHIYNPHHVMTEPSNETHHTQTNEYLANFFGFAQYCIKFIPEYAVKVLCVKIPMKENVKFQNMKDLPNSTTLTALMKEQTPLFGEIEI